VLRRPVESAQYTSDDFQQLLKAQGITCSMSRRGECWDNAAMESFFSSMKTERLSRKVYRTREEARSDVFDYIERFYNPVRKHSRVERPLHPCYRPHNTCQPGRASRTTSRSRGERLCLTSCSRSMARRQKIDVQ